MIIFVSHAARLTIGKILVDPAGELYRRKIAYLTLKDDKGMF
jgi:hypothetical protein